MIDLAMEGFGPAPAAEAPRVPDPPAPLPGPWAPAPGPVPATPAPIKFFVPGKPTTKNKRRAMMVGGKPRVIPGKGDEDKVRAFQAVAFEHRPPVPWECPVRLTLAFTLPIARSWPKKKRAKALAGDLPHISKPDTTRLTTFVEDSLSGVFYLDDVQVVEVHARKTYGPTPGTSVCVEPLL